MENLGTFLLVTVALLTSLPALAATMRTGHTLLESLPIENDVYLAGGKVIVEGEIGGDAVVAGGQLLLNAPVANAAAATISKRMSFPSVGFYRWPKLGLSP